MHLIFFLIFFRLGVDSAQGDSTHLDSARLDSAHLNSAQMATKVFFHRRSRQNRATRDFGLADLSRCDYTAALCSIFF